MIATGTAPQGAGGPSRGTGSPIPVRAVIAGVVAAVMVGLAAVLLMIAMQNDAPPRIVIATGSESGTYHALGVAIADVLESEGVVESVELLPTAGSVANMALVGGPDRRVDFAFVQSDTRAVGNVRLVAPLYQEVLHILVATRVAGEIATIDDLDGRTVSLGAEESGTRSVAERVIEHFGVTVGEDLALPPPEVASGLTDGTIDAAFLLSAIPSRLVEDLCERDAVRFLTLGDPQLVGNEADALELVFPSVTSTVVPTSTYGGLPRRPVATIQVGALFVVSGDLDEGLVKTITTTLFAHRSRLVTTVDEGFVAARMIREKYTPDSVLIPYHGGAADYYHRSDPPFIVEYAETLSFVLTVVVGLWSVTIAARQWMQRKMKNRIDVFYVEVEELATDIERLTLEELMRLREALRDLQRRAFAELVAERLEANESFTIFQDYVASERAAINARIAEKTSKHE